MTKHASAPAGAEASLFSTYAKSARHGFDEAFDDAHRPRAHWQALLNAFEDLAPGELAARTSRIERRVRETGIAYDIFSHPKEPTQRWQLDLMPIVFSVEEWTWLEAALVQRARLMDAILADVYGDANVMRRGLVPPELIYADPFYLRPCQGIVPKAGPLHFYAADLARGPGGGWMLIDSHTETLAGIGFAVANRIVHTHVAGDIFKRCNAVRLAPFFHSVQAELSAHAGRENARIALLTPGPHHEDYFSHAYLARYLGYLLVEGPDLRTKGNKVFLKTLEGLKEIDLLIRCVDGRIVDALELDPAGFAGPPGLLRVNRANPRLVVNAIGSAVVQNRALGPFLGQLSQELLGETLALPDTERLWLGDETSRRHVLANLDRFVVRKAQEGTSRPGHAAVGRAAHSLSAAEREELVAEISLSGSGLVAEEAIGFSEAPAFNRGTLTRRPFAVRLFVASTATGYAVMPGGLALTVEPRSVGAMSTPEGHTRDVWVLSDDEQRPHVSLWRPMLETARVERSQRVIQSRVADDLFWLGRYNERADWVMRVLRGAYRRIVEDSGTEDGLQAARRCLEVLLGEDAAKEAAAKRNGDAGVEQLARSLITDPKRSRALVRTLENIYRCANLARDRLSFEAWHTLSRFRPGDTFITALDNAGPSTTLDLLEEGLASIAAFNGLMHENMTRNFGWSFLDMGRRLERAYNLSEAIKALFVPAADPEEEGPALQLILELADSFITYRSRYRLDPSLPLVLDLLLLDESNPRSLSFQLSAISRQLEGLPGTQRGSSLTEDRRLILSLLTATRLIDIEALAAEPNRAGLARAIGEAVRLLPELSNAIGRHYFNLADEAPHRMQTGASS